MISQFLHSGKPTSPWKHPPFWWYFCSSATTMKSWLYSLASHHLVHVFKDYCKFCFCCFSSIHHWTTIFLFTKVITTLCPKNPSHSYLAPKTGILLLMVQKSGGFTSWGNGSLCRYLDKVLFIHPRVVVWDFFHQRCTNNKNLTSSNQTGLGAHHCWIYSTQTLIFS